MGEELKYVQSRWSKHIGEVTEQQQRLSEGIKMISL